MNRVVLSACIVEASALRYTPAGIAALDFRLEHESQVEEAGQSRLIKANVKTLALGALAEQLVRHPLGYRAVFTGFLATPRNGKYVIFHIQGFQPIS